jgi:hypothetical protein
MCERVREHFDRDVPAQVDVRGPINFPHAARTDLGADFIRAKSRTKGKCHYAPQAFYAISPE